MNYGGAPGSTKPLRRPMTRPISRTAFALHCRMHVELLRSQPICDCGPTNTSSCVVAAEAGSGRPCSHCAMISDQTRRVCYPTQMVLARVKNSHRVIAVLALMIASLLCLRLLPPIPQDQNYHDFADQRTLLGIPNFWNVVSNIPFILIGAAGLWALRLGPAIAILFLGFLLTGFGSAYYHLDPDDSTLFWDRLPMAVSFMAILAIGIEERVDAKAGTILLWPLIALGVFSLYLWRLTGDL